MEYQTKTNLIFPFNGIWLVSNGGRTPQTNNHVRPVEQGPQNQLHAYDFRTESKGDVLPGERDRSVGVRNAIIIDQQNGEYSLLCHFKHNSIKVKLEIM